MYYLFVKIKQNLKLWAMSKEKALKNRNQHNYYIPEIITVMTLVNFFAVFSICISIQKGVGVCV